MTVRAVRAVRGAQSQGRGARDIPRRRLLRGLGFEGGAAYYRRDVPPAA